MENPLRERNRDFFLGKALLDLGRILPTQVKVVLRTGPGPKSHVHGAVFEPRNKELGFRLAHKERFSGHHVAHDVKRLFRGVSIVDPDRNFEPTERVLAKVHDRLAPQCRIRRRNIQAIQRTERGIKEPDSYNVTLDVAAFNVVARLKGAKEQQEQARGDVCQGIFQNR